jgi:1-pyrroline-5-carboxylate dehydrogenase
MGPVIDAPAFRKISEYIDLAESSPETTILTGGGKDDSVGYFIEPTIVQTTDPKHRLMEEEIFGPVLTVYVYPEAAFEETLRLCDETSPYALTVDLRPGPLRPPAAEVLRHAAGNFP